MPLLGDLRMRTLKPRRYQPSKVYVPQVDTSPLDHLPLSNRLKKALIGLGVITAAQLERRLAAQKQKEAA